MAETLQFDLVSPERRLASYLATEVQIPGADGDMTAMKDHAPIITTLRPGVLKVDGPEGAQSYLVTGGFAEITGEGTSVLAERAIPVADAKADELDALIEAASTTVANSSDAAKDAADKTLADLTALKAELGL